MPLIFFTICIWKTRYINLFDFNTSTKSWRGYIFITVCLCMCLCVSVSLSLSLCEFLRSTCEQIFSQTDVSVWTRFSRSTREQSEVSKTLQINWHLSWYQVVCRTDPTGLTSLQYYMQYASFRKNCFWYNNVNSRIETKLLSVIFMDSVSIENDWLNAIHKDKLRHCKILRACCLSRLASDFGSEDLGFDSLHLRCEFYPWER